MATTSNYSWTTPDDTDLVKDGASAIRTLGSAIDTTVFTNAGAAVAKATVDAKGDLLVGTADNTVDRLAVGANDLVITAASGETTGLKYTGAWSNYTPSLTNLTLGNGTLQARFRQIGKMVDVVFSFALGSTSAVGSDPTFTLPVTSVWTNIPFNAFFQDSGTATYVGFANLGASSATFFASNANGIYTAYAGVTATVPFTWTTNDFIVVTLSYEVA